MRYLAALWGIAGVLLLLGQASFRLFNVSMDAWDHPLRWPHWIALAAVLLFMAYSEGYRGFQKSFSPRVVARAQELARGATFAQGCLAPLYCMGFFWATRRRMITSYSLTFGIILLIVLVRTIAQPWRGIIDVGVVLGLVWGMLSILVLAVRATLFRRFEPAPTPPAPQVRT